MRVGRCVSSPQSSPHYHDVREFLDTKIFFESQIFFQGQISSSSARGKLRTNKTKNMGAYWTWHVALFK